MGYTKQVSPYLIPSCAPFSSIDQRFSILFATDRVSIERLRLPPEQRYLASTYRYSLRKVAAGFTKATLIA